MLGIPIDEFVCILAFKQGYTKAKEHMMRKTYFCVHVYEAQDIRYKAMQNSTVCVCFVCFNANTLFIKIVFKRCIDQW